MTSTWYSLDDIMRKLINDYNLKKLRDVDDYFQNADYNSCRQTVRRTLDRLGLLKSGIYMKNPNTNRKAMYYSVDQLALLLDDQQFQSYLIKNTFDDNIKQQHSINVLIEESQQAEIELADYNMQSYMFGNKPDPHQEYVVTDEEVDKEMIKMMLTALFERYFTPFDRTMLRNDMEWLNACNEMHLEPEDIVVRKRKDNPEGSYYMKRDIAKK